TRFSRDWSSDVCSSDLFSPATRFSTFSSWSFSLRSRKNPHDGSGHQVCHGASEHGADAESCELATLFRRKCADAADLDTDGAKRSEERRVGKGWRAREK